MCVCECGCVVFVCVCVCFVREGEMGGGGGCTERVCVLLDREIEMVCEFVSFYINLYIHRHCFVVGMCLCERERERESRCPSE